MLGNWHAYSCTEQNKMAGRHMYCADDWDAKAVFEGLHLHVHDILVDKGWDFRQFIIMAAIAIIRV